MGYVDCQSLSYVLPDGRVLSPRPLPGRRRHEDGAGGCDGTGKTTLLRIIAVT